jgi:transposase-like protein
MMALSKRHRSAEEWREVFTRQASSGLSVQAFCTRESINTSSFYRWRRVAGDPQVATTHERGVAASEVVRVPPLTAQSEFVDLGSLASRRSRIELRFDLGEGLLLTMMRE